MPKKKVTLSKKEILLADAKRQCRFNAEDKVWHECKDVDIAVWLNDLSNLETDCYSDNSSILLFNRNETEQILCVDSIIPTKGK